MKEVVQIGFELSNLHRRYLGLQEVKPGWDKIWIDDNVFLYFEGDIIRKMIHYYGYPLGYEETDHYEHTADNRTILLPKTKRGKPKKLNFTATHSFSSHGVYFYYSSTYIRIGNFTTSTTFYEDDNESKLSIGEWLDMWVNETTDNDLEELRRFIESKRVHQKYNEGDFFTFKIGRNKWGFGRILLNIAERRKDEQFRKDNPGFNNLMGRPLYIGIYRKLADTIDPEIDIINLPKYGMLHTQPIMDNRLFYGEYRIIGNKPVEPHEWEPVISYSNNYRDASGIRKAYLQYGLIGKVRESWDADYNLIKDKNDLEDVFRNEYIGFGMRRYGKIEKLINGEIDEDSLLWEHDLRKKSNLEIKRDIFRHFGLDSNKNYAENLSLTETSKNKNWSRRILDNIQSLLNCKPQD